MGPHDWLDRGVSDVVFLVSYPPPSALSRHPPLTNLIRTITVISGEIDEGRHYVPSHGMIDTIYIPRSKHHAEASRDLQTRIRPFKHRYYPLLSISAVSPRVLPHRIYGLILQRHARWDLQGTYRVVQWHSHSRPFSTPSRPLQGTTTLEVLYKRLSSPASPHQPAAPHARSTAARPSMLRCRRGNLSSR